VHFGLHSGSCSGFEKRERSYSSDDDVDDDDDEKRPERSSLKLSTMDTCWGALFVGDVACWGESIRIHPPGTASSNISHLEVMIGDGVASVKF
jgi:hypothetical protein